MNSVKRYDPQDVDIEPHSVFTAQMVLYPTGDYVEYKDWEEMADNYIDLKIKYDRLVNNLGDLWRDA